MGHVCQVPYRDFAHFMGRKKPWQNGYHPSFLTITANNRGYVLARRIWLQELVEINTKHSMGIDFKAWEASEQLKEMKESPLGCSAMYEGITLKMGIKLGV